MQPLISRVVRVSFLEVSFLVLLLFSGNVWGQSSMDSLKSFQFNIEECVNYALEHQHDVVNARLDKQMAREQIGENRGKLLPHINISGGLVDNLKLPTSLIPDFSDPSSDKKVPVQFGNKYTSSITAEATQTLFNNNYFLGLKAAKIFQELSVKSLQRTRIEIIAAVKKAYFNVLVNQEAIRLGESNVSQLKKSLSDIKNKYEVGMAETVDVNRIQSQYNTANTGLMNQKRLLALSLQVLKFQMGISPRDSLSLTESVHDFSPNLGSQEPLNYNLTDRPEYDMQQVQINLNKLSLKSTRSSFLPTLSLYLNGGYNFFGTRFSELYNQGFGNSALGVNLSFPIFSGTERIHQTNQAKITLEQSQNDLKYLADQIQVEVQQAYVDYRNNKDQLNTQKENMKLTQGVYDRINYKYEKGVATSLDLLSAENELQRVQSDYIDALLKTMISRVELQRATGRLNPANQ